MRKMIAVLAACAAVSLPRIVESATLTALPESKLWFDGDSTFHPFSAKATAIDLQGTLTAAAANPLLGENALSAMTLTVPVKALKSGESALDKNMYKAMKTEQFQDIVFKLGTYDVAASTIPNTYAVTAKGDLTIAGHTEPVTLTGLATPSDKSVRFKGRYELLMSTYGIKPPQLMFGAIKVRDRTVVGYDLQLAAGASEPAAAKAVPETTPK